MTDPRLGLPDNTRRVDPAALARQARTLRTILLVAFVAVVVVPWGGRLSADYLWFQEVGYSQVFSTEVAWRWAMFLLHGGIAFAFMYFNVARARPTSTRELGRFAAGFGVSPGDVARLLGPVVVAAMALVALAIAFGASARWLSFLMAGRGGDTGITEPLFGNDVSFYLFRLPAISATLSTAIAIVLITTVVTVVLYALKGELRVSRLGGETIPRAAWHVAGLVAFYFVLIAAQLWIVTRAELASSTTGPLVGASYTDVHARLPGIVAAAIAAIGAAGLALYGARSGRLARFVLAGAVGYGAISMLGRVVIPGAMQRLLVAPNELERETPYLERHIKATRAAWGLEDVVTRDLSGDVQLTMADIRANGPTVTNVRLWERDLLAQTLGQLQEIRTYYDFVSVSDDRYMIDGKYRQVHLAARELNPALLPTRSFINERFAFTHGMGLAMAPVNEVTSEGLPVLFVKDLPPVSTTSLKLTKPAVYFGELTNSYVFVGTKQPEFDFPSGEANAYTRYNGRAGIPVGSVARRALFAWQLNSLKILLSSDIGDSAKVLMRRNVSERAQTALPFLRFDPESYLVVADDGRLVWMLDAYTTSTHYPYAARTADGLSYMRNSVKVTVDAYHGTVTAYLADTTDAIAAAYQRIFPGVFHPMDSLPADLKKHLRYPSVLFRAQASFLGTYHMDQPNAFYHREDQWQIPDGAQRERGISPYMRHMIMRLPGEKEPEFIYMTPFTPRGKDNLAAWLVARMDGDQYGKLVVYRFPKQSLVYGPKQIANRIEQDTEISRQLTLWGQGGSQAIRGELLVIPIEESLIYVQPIYLRAEGGAIPELKRVVVAHGNQVAMGTTLDEGLAMVFGGTTAGSARPTTREATGGAAAPGDASATIANLLQRSQQHYDRAISAQRAGNWAEYGREIELLGAVLRELRARSTPR